MRKHITITAGSSALLLALTGCGQPAEEEEFNEQMEEVADEMSQDPPGADIEDSDVWVGEGEMPPQYVGISEGMTSVDRTYTGRMGADVDAEIGEPVEIDQSPTVSYGDYVGTMTLDRVETLDSCDTGDGQHVAEDGGQLVQARFTIDTTDSDETFDLSGPNFYSPDESATNAEESSIYGDYDLWMCQNQPGQPEDVEPGQEVERTLIFELPEADSPIIYTSGLFDVTWDWAGEGDAEETAEAEESDALPDAEDVDLYGGGFSHPDEVMVDIDSLSDCETADAVWGGLINGELEGFEIDQGYLSELESWMQANGCW